MSVAPGIEIGCHVEPHDNEVPTPPPSPPPQTRDAQDRDEEIGRLLEKAQRRSREEPGSITIWVPSPRIGGEDHKR